MYRVFEFLKDVKNELKQVIWPTRRDTIRYTATVIAFSVAVAIILGAADYGLLQGFEAILNK